MKLFFCGFTILVCIRLYSFISSKGRGKKEKIIIWMLHTGIKKNFLPVTCLILHKICDDEFLLFDFCQTQNESINR